MIFSNCYNDCQYWKPKILWKISGIVLSHNISKVHNSLYQNKDKPCKFGQILINHLSIQEQTVKIREFCEIKNLSITVFIQSGHETQTNYNQ